MERLNTKTGATKYLRSEGKFSGVESRSGAKIVLE